MPQEWETSPPPLPVREEGKELTAEDAEDAEGWREGRMAGAICQACRNVPQDRESQGRQWVADRGREGRGSWGSLLADDAADYRGAGARGGDGHGSATPSNIGHMFLMREGRRGESRESRGGDVRKGGDWRALKDWTAEGRGSGVRTAPVEPTFRSGW
jgi:hypothetical protein